MRFFSTVFVSVLVSASAFATQPPAKANCTYDQIRQAGDQAVNDNSKVFEGAVSFVSGTVGLSNSVDQQTGLTEEIYYPYSLLDGAGRVLAQGIVLLDGNCKFKGGLMSSDVHTTPLH